MNFKTSIIACALLCWQGVGWACEYDSDIPRLNAVEKKIDDTFNGGARGRRTAERIAEAAACRAFENSLIGACKQMIRNRVDAATLTFDSLAYPKVKETDVGFSVRVNGTTAGGPFFVSCYTTKDGDLLRIVAD